MCRILGGVLKLRALAIPPRDFDNAQTVELPLSCNVDPEPMKNDVHALGLLSHILQCRASRPALTLDPRFLRNCFSRFSTVSSKLERQRSIHLSSMVVLASSVKSNVHQHVIR